MNYKRVGIVGVGMVGGTLKGWFRDAKTYDKFKPSANTLKEVLDQDVIFLAVNLPEDGLGEGEFKAIFEILNQAPGGKIVISKMTTYPGFTEKLSQAFPNLCIFHNPEFLTESQADHDFRNPPFQILGTTRGSEYAADILNILPSAPVSRVVDSKESEMFKLVRNALLASKVVLANNIYDICEGSKVDYEVIRDLFKHDHWIGGSHSQIFHKGYRGYGGKCLPKDIQGLIRFKNELGIGEGVFEAIEEINKKLTNENKTG